MSQKLQILLVEDDVWLAELYQDALQQGIVDSDVRVAATAEAALTAFEERHPDIILLDMFLPGHNGIELLHELASYQDSNCLPIIILSSVPPRDFGLPPQRWHHYGVVEYLYKPETKPFELVAAVQKQLITAEAA